MTKLRFIAPVLLLALALSGCAGSGGPASDATETSSASATSAPATTPTTTPTASPTVIPSATPTSTPVATSTPEADAPPALEDLKLSSEGLGYVRVGQPVPAHDAKSAIVTWKQPFCEGDKSADGPGAWKTDYPNIENDNLAFYVQAKEKTSPVEIIYILSDKIRTEHGLHIGSTLVDVKKLGGVHEKANTKGLGLEPYVIHGSGGELVFWVAQKTTDEAPKDTVQHIDVQPEGKTPMFAFEITPCD